MESLPILPWASVETGIRGPRTLGEQDALTQSGITANDIVRNTREWFMVNGKNLQLAVDRFTTGTRKIIMEMKNRDLARIKTDFRNVDKGGNLRSGASLTQEEERATQYPGVYGQAHGTTESWFYFRKSVFDDVTAQNSPNYRIAVFLRSEGWEVRFFPEPNIEALIAGITRVN